MLTKACVTHKTCMYVPSMYTNMVTCSFKACSTECRVRPFNLGFQQTEHLHNPLNEGKPVKICRDGQELPPDLGAQLCQLIEDAADKAGVPRPGTLKPEHSHSRAHFPLSMQLTRQASLGQVQPPGATMSFCKTMCWC